GEVELVEALGNELQVHFRVDATRVRSEDALAATEEADLSDLPSGPLGPSDYSEGVARVDPRSRMRAGDRATFAVDTERLHFFDTDTGEAVWK
ncbi:MAG: ABC transporter ATP-binding protein, partial [Acidimicrobiales bacterium]